MIHYMTTQGIGDAWVGNEVRIIQGADIPVTLHALVRPEKTYFNSPDITAMADATRVIYPLFKVAALGAVAKGPARFGKKYWAALGDALFGPRESLRNRLVGLWHFAVACHWAALLADDEVTHIHSQWIHSGGTVAMYGAWLLGRSFSFTGHAADLFRNRSALSSKIARAEFIICISEFHRQFYLKNGADADKLHIAYCGIDTSHFTPARRVRGADEPLHILSSGRLVAKKGFPILIEACGLLRARGLDFRCTIAGSGPDEGALRDQIAKAGLDDIITLTGEAIKQEDIPAFMYSGDVYTLPCVWAADNDVDGLPQMLMEAMACGLPAVSTDLVGIPDLVIDGETGLLVAPENAVALTDALERLAQDEELSQTLASSGYRHLIDKFDLQTCLEPLILKYKARLYIK
jgi:glycosyltransferase involved in cell wall biosynthesis